MTRKSSLSRSCLCDISTAHRNEVLEWINDNITQHSSEHEPNIPTIQATHCLIRAFPCDVDQRRRASMSSTPRRSNHKHCPHNRASRTRRFFLVSVSILQVIFSAVQMWVHESFLVFLNMVNENVSNCRSWGGSHMFQPLCAKQFAPKFRFLERGLSKKQKIHRGENSR